MSACDCEIRRETGLASKSLVVLFMYYMWDGSNISLYRGFYCSEHTIHMHSRTVGRQEYDVHNCVVQVLLIRHPSSRIRKKSVCDIADIKSRTVWTPKIENLSGKRNQMFRILWYFTTTAFVKKPQLQPSVEEPQLFYPYFRKLETSDFSAAIWPFKTSVS